MPFTMSGAPAEAPLSRKAAADLCTSPFASQPACPAQADVCQFCITRISNPYMILQILSPILSPSITHKDHIKA